MLTNESPLTKAALIIDWIASLVLMLYFTAVAPYPPITGFQGLLILSPPLFGLPGLITALLGRRQGKTALNTFLLVVNTIFLLWWPLYWVGGTLLAGV